MSHSECAYVAPRTPVEEMLARIWTQVLGCERVGIQDTFQSLSGTSLHATRIFARLRDELGINVSRSLILQAPTIAQMAAYIEAFYQQEAQQQSVAMLKRAQGSQEDIQSSIAK